MKKQTVGIVVLNRDYFMHRFALAPLTTRMHSLNPKPESLNHKKHDVHFPFLTNHHKRCAQGWEVSHGIITPTYTHMR